MRRNFRVESTQVQVTMQVREDMSRNKEGGMRAEE
jgi:hypothetical protein